MLVWVDPYVTMIRPLVPECTTSHFVAADAEPTSQTLVDIGDGYCASFKELAQVDSPGKCMTMANANAACVDTTAVSFGKGSRARRCLCDTTVSCGALDGLVLGANGYDRFSQPGRYRVVHHPASHMCLSAAIASLVHWCICSEPV